MIDPVFYAESFRHYAEFFVDGIKVSQTVLTKDGLYAGEQPHFFLLGKKDEGKFLYVRISSFRSFTQFSDPSFMSENRAISLINQQRMDYLLVSMGAVICGVVLLFLFFSHSSFFITSSLWCLSTGLMLLIGVSFSIRIEYGRLAHHVMSLAYLCNIPFFVGVLASVMHGKYRHFFWVQSIPSVLFMLTYLISIVLKNDHLGFWAIELNDDVIKILGLTSPAIFLILLKKLEPDSKLIFVGLFGSSLVALVFMIEFVVDRVFGIYAPTPFMAAIIWVSLRKYRKASRALYEREGLIRIRELHEEMLMNLKVAMTFQSKNLPIDICRRRLKNFVCYWSPKDKVSGDYVWACSDFNGFSIAVYDCTGHGIAASIKAMMVKVMLDQLHVRDSIEDPQKILIRLAKEWKKMGLDLSDDGFDICYLAIDFNDRRIRFSGTRMGFYLVNGEEVKLIKGGPRKIGVDPIKEMDKLEDIDIRLAPGVTGLKKMDDPPTT